MISSEQAWDFAHDWVKAWNSHDLEAILEHYADDAELTSPFVVQVLGDPTGTIKGKENLRLYFGMGLAMFPDLEFHLIEVFAGVSSLVLHYRSVNDTVGAEVIVFDSRGKAAKVLAHYSTV